ncbi:complex I subunit 4 family protein [Consotaella salsifontis]|uniref:NADH dehydrogenase subunit M n=1 Tax=Consotaella salsifontis TaxID=1365950 RepID=A0A1T4RMG0_9HYPH|nr:NADH-quinone oxidoreductase subunit M [Consotaella salsifontis]SKA17077.1 NADH dehydrogenase subunit M [Consotaella salsifontis]
MLTLAILLPLIASLALALGPGFGERVARVIALVASALSLLALVVVWLGFDTGAGAPAFQAVAEFAWIPALGVAWRVGVDGMALAVALMSALLFVGSIAWPADYKGKARQYYAWFLFLQGVSLGLFLALDLLLFYVFFDLSLVGMYFLIGRWGHGDAEYAALKFFIYTLAGSLAMLLAILALVLANDTLTFDMRALIAAQPLRGTDLKASLVLFGLLLGFAIKTPLVPFHTWLPLAHVEAPGPASAILAGVLLKMGTYGIVRIPFSMMRETFAAYALPLAILALVSILWGAIVALGQTSLKRRIAYTSVNHMGYTVLGIAAAGAALGAESARTLALTGAVTEMVAHGLITGSLFLMAGSFWQRAQTYEMSAFGGLARTAPKLTAAFFLAAFASLGLPALAGFVAEFQIFAGTFAVYPWLAAVALIGIVVTAALFLSMAQKLFMGRAAVPTRDFPDFSRTEAAVVAGLLVLVVLIGIYPSWLLTLIETGSAFLPGAGGVR